jgi:hypothetical protein
MYGNAYCSVPYFILTETKTTCDYETSAWTDRKQTEGIEEFGSWEQQYHQGHHDEIPDQ